MKINVKLFLTKWMFYDVKIIMFLIMFKIEIKKKEMGCFYFILI